MTISPVGATYFRLTIHFCDLNLSCSINDLKSSVMPSYRQLSYHTIFRTKDSLPTIEQASAFQLYSFITGIIKHKGCHLYRINGVENHLHLLTDLHPSIALADFLRDIKASSSKWMQESNLFPAFKGWAEGYGSFTCSYRDIGKVIEYIKNQEEPHRKKTFEDEYRRLLMEYGIKIDERFFP
jgi:putative transposase